MATEIEFKTMVALLDKHELRDGDRDRILSGAASFNLEGTIFEVSDNDAQMYRTFEREKPTIDRERITTGAKADVGAHVADEVERQVFGRIRPENDTTKATKGR